MTSKTKSGLCQTAGWWQQTTCNAAKGGLTCIRASAWLSGCWECPWGYSRSTWRTDHFSAREMKKLPGYTVPRAFHTATRTTWRRVLLLCIPPPLLYSCLSTFIPTAQIQAAEAQTYFWKGCLLDVGLVKHNPRTLTVKAVQNNACAIIPSVHSLRRCCISCTLKATQSQAKRHTLHLPQTLGRVPAGCTLRASIQNSPYNSTSFCTHVQMIILSLQMFHVLPCQVSCPKVSLPSSGHHRWGLSLRRPQHVGNVKLGCKVRAAMKLELSEISSRLVWGKKSPKSIAALW